MGPLEAKRLVPNYNGRSSVGVPYLTNALGFRCSEERYGKPLQEGVVLAGDSFTFGLYVPYEGTWPYFFERSLSRVGDSRWAHVQAIPGGSPAMTLSHLFGADRLASKVPTKLMLHSISHYDFVDNMLFLHDQEELDDAFRYAMRWTKVHVAPYFLNMMQLKIRHFLQKDRRQQMLFADDVFAERRMIMRKVLAEMKAQCEKEGWLLAFYYMPNEKEVLTPGWEHTRVIEDMLRDLELSFFHLEMELELDKDVDLKKLYRDDKLHLNEKGAEVVGEKLAQYVLKNSW